MKKTIGYVRVSTEEQAEKGVSLEAQEAKIRAWASLNDYLTVEIYKDEGISGTVSPDKRSGLQRALSRLGRGDALVVYSLSRLSRSTRDTLQLSDLLAKKDIDLVSLSEKIDTTTAAGKLYFRIMAVLNEFERDQISERTKTAIQHKKSQGQAYNQEPFGYRREGDRFVPDEKEQAIIRQIESLSGQGWNYSKIATQLNASGLKTKFGRQFYPQTVKNVVQRVGAA